ncbi:uncharacterized protein LOC108664431, partial [Hyalella azteca]|uniref:Uncharacterized protein LOC108664431 n=1 Tax=Hyalella azteca TaxID=294128 RepID=A0A8B7MZ07_HYAAZ
MSSSGGWQDGKSQIPILKSPSPTERKVDNSDHVGKLTNDKLKKRSSSVLSLFHVTHKVPSHIVSPKSPKDADQRTTDWNEGRQYLSNLELSKCASNFDEDSNSSERSKLSRSGMHSSVQDLNMTWWQKKPPTKDTANHNLFSDIGEKSASISNIFDGREANDNGLFSENSNAPMSLPGIQGFRDDRNSCHDLLKQPSHYHQPALALNSGMRTQFRSEQNLFNSSPSHHDSGLYSLDYNHPSRGTFSKFNFDISTIKELPEDRSDSPAKNLLESDSVNNFDVVQRGFIPTPAISTTSFADMYRSLQDLRANVQDIHQPVSLVSQTGGANQSVLDNSGNQYADEENYFRSIQDLRDPSFSLENIPFSMDYIHLGRNEHCSAFDLPNEVQKSVTSPHVLGFDDFAARDRSVSMMDITAASTATETQNFNRKNASRIPKRRHTVTVQDFKGVCPDGNTTRSMSMQNISEISETKNDHRGKALNNSDSSTSSCDKSLGAERKKGCVGCQHRRERKPVVRQLSLPPLKSRPRSEGSRVPLNRSCSNPSPSNRKRSQPQESDPADLANENNSKDNNNMDAERSEVERLRDELQMHRRTIRQLSLRPA